MTAATTLTVLGIDHVQIAAPAGSEDELRRFYGGLMGLPEIAKPEALRSRGGLWFDCGGMQLHVGIDAESPANAPSRRHVAFRVSDLPAARRALAAAGCEIEEDQAPIADVARFYTRDPVGNRVELLQRAP